MSNQVQDLFFMIQKFTRSGLLEFELRNDTQKHKQSTCPRCFETKISF